MPEKNDFFDELKKQQKLMNEIANIAKKPIDEIENMQKETMDDIALIVKEKRLMDEITHLRNNPVIEICQAIKSYVENFERDLDEEHEIGIRLASFGGIVFFHAQQIGFSKPNIITFYGVTDEGDKVQLIQHVSQLNFLLKAVKRREDKKNPIRFIYDD